MRRPLVRGDPGGPAPRGGTAVTAAADAPSTKAAERSAPAAVGAGDDLEDVAAGVLPVHAPAAVVGVELARPPLARIRPVRQFAGTDPAEDLVEVGFGHQEGVVLRADGTVIVGEVQGDVVAGPHDQERPKRLRVAEPEDLGQEARRLMLVPDSHDGVVQLDTHRDSSQYRSSKVAWRPPPRRGRRAAGSGDRRNAWLYAPRPALANLNGEAAQGPPRAVRPGLSGRGGTHVVGHHAPLALTPGVRGRVG